MTTEPLDSGDLDALEALVASDGWLLVEGRVREEIDLKRDALERNDNAAAENRGFLAACRMFLALPQNLSAEAKEKR